MTNLKWVKQMEQWYDSDDIDHSITHYGFDKDKPKTWRSTAYLHGRYVLKVVVPIEIDYQNCRIVKAVGEPQIFLGEIKDIEIDNDGAASYGYVRNVVGWPFDPKLKVWDMLEKTNGDISALPIKIDKDNPLPLFDAFRKSSGRDIVRP